MRKSLTLAAFLLSALLAGCTPPPPAPPAANALTGKIFPNQSGPYKCDCASSTTTFARGPDGHYRGTFDMGNGQNLSLEFFEESPGEWRVFAGACASAELSALTKATYNPGLILTIKNAGNILCCGGNFGLFTVVITE